MHTFIDNTCHQRRSHSLLALCPLLTMAMNCLVVTWVVA